MIDAGCPLFLWLLFATHVLAIVTVFALLRRLSPRLVEVAWSLRLRFVTIIAVGAAAGAGAVRIGISLLLLAPAVSEIMSWLAAIIANNMRHIPFGLGRSRSFGFVFALLALSIALFAFRRLRATTLGSSRLQLSCKSLLLLIELGNLAILAGHLFLHLSFLGSRLLLARSASSRAGG